VPTRSCSSASHSNWKILKVREKRTGDLCARLANHALLPLTQLATFYKSEIRTRDLCAGSFMLLRPLTQLTTSDRSVNQTGDLCARLANHALRPLTQLATFDKSEIRTRDLCACLFMLYGLSLNWQHLKGRRIEPRICEPAHSCSTASHSTGNI
jgi:hypothetical protein